MSSQTPKSVKFFDRYLKEKALAEDIDEYTDSWHADFKGKEIYEFLGMSEKEYSLWLRDPDTLPHIARARRTGLPLEVVISAALEELSVEALPVNATKADRLMQWLRQMGEIHAPSKDST